MCRDSEKKKLMISSEIVVSIIKFECVDISLRFILIIFKYACVHVHVWAQAGETSGIRPSGARLIGHDPPDTDIESTIWALSQAWISS